ncbi:MAG: PRTRC system protein B, partial [Candidatus Baltobacteraceae bacterium]
IYRHGDETLAVEHSVREKKGVTPYLGPGRFVTRGVIEALLRVMNKGPLRYIPPNVVAISHRAIAWFEPVSIRTMYFRPDRDAAVAAFDGKAVPQPPLLFVARERELRVFALAVNERPTLDTSLCAAPYWNIYGNQHHSVCLGTMVVPNSVEPEKTSAWTEAFFASEFTHLSGTKCWAHPGTYAELLADAIALGWFKSEWLRPAGLTIAQAVKHSP